MKSRFIIALSYFSLLTLIACSGGGGGGVSGRCIVGSGDWCGTKLLGVAAATTRGYSVATDTNGNAYVAGVTGGNLDSQTKTGTNDFFVTKYNSTGTKQFTRLLGVAAVDTYGYSVATDASGNVFVAGYTDGNLDGQTKMGTIDFFVTKYNSTGTKLFTKLLGVASASTIGRSVATDASGNVFVAGHTNGALDSQTKTGTIDFFVTKYNSTGTKQFTRLLGVASASTRGFSVATDASGNVYVAGETNGSLPSNTLAGTTDSFVAKYNSAGTWVFTKQLGVASANTSGLSVATDASGNVFVAGYTQGALDGQTKTDTRDFFVTKYDSTGAKQFTRLLGVAAAHTFGLSVATDASGNVFVAGYTDGALDSQTKTGTRDFFVTKYDSTGTKQFTRLLGVAAANTYGRSVATDASGNVFVAGYTDGNLDGNTLTGSNDFFVTKYDSSGVKQ